MDAKGRSRGSALFHLWSVPTPRGSPGRGSVGSVPGAVDQLVLGDPGHHAPQLLADRLDRMGVVHAAGRLELRLPGPILPDPLGGERTRLDVLEDFAHLRLGLVRNDARSGNILTELRSVGDR